MKKIFFVIIFNCLLVLQNYNTQTNELIFEGVITQNKNNVITIVFDTHSTIPLCQLPKNKDEYECKHRVYDVPLENWSELTVWKDDSTNVGTILKGKLSKTGSIIPVKSCEIRTQEMINEYCGEGLYCKPPAQLRPEDCKKESSDFIKELLKQISK